MHDHFSHFGIGKNIFSLLRGTTIGLRWLNTCRPILTAALCVEQERCKPISTNFRPLRYQKEHLLKCPWTSLLKCLLHIMAIKNILVMVDHLTSWLMIKAILDKEATTVANAIFEKLILEHGSPEILLSDNGKEFTNDTLAYVCQEFGIEQHFTSPYTPRSNGKTENFNKFLKASIRKLCQEDKSSWDQVLDQILFSCRCYPHTSTGEVPYTLVYNRDLPIPIHKLIKVVEPYMGENTLGKRVEQSRVFLSIAAKMLEKDEGKSKEVLSK